jgi:hypothetical protein
MPDPFGILTYAGIVTNACRLQFWEPRQLPDARWYSAMYGERDARMLLLDPPHHLFSKTPLEDSQWRSRESGEPPNLRGVIFQGPKLQNTDRRQ